MWPKAGFVIAVVSRQCDKRFLNHLRIFFTSLPWKSVFFLSKVIGKNKVFYPTAYNFTAPYGPLRSTNA